MRIVSIVFALSTLYFKHFIPAVANQIDADGGTQTPHSVLSKKIDIESMGNDDKGFYPWAKPQDNEDEHADDDNDPDYVPDTTIHIKAVDLSGFTPKTPKKKRPFVLSQALGANLPPLPKELETAAGVAVWSAICDGAYYSYAGLTRSQRRFLKENGFQEMMPSPSKKARPTTPTTIQNPSRPFDIDGQRQGYTRTTYRFIVDETRQNASFQEMMQPILDNHRTAMAQGIAPNPMETNGLFWKHVAHFFDIQERVDDHIFFLNSDNICHVDPHTGENAAARMARGLNPLMALKDDTQARPGNYHHLTQGKSSPEILIYISADFHEKHHDLLHPFLKPGADSLVHTPEGNLAFAQSKKKLHRALADKMNHGENKRMAQNTNLLHPIGLKRNLNALFNDMDHVAGIEIATSQPPTKKPYLAL